MFHQQNILGLLLDGARDALPVLRAGSQRAENQQIQGALQQGDSGRHMTPV